MKISEDGRYVIKCVGCGQERDASWLILFGYDEFHELYCSLKCCPPGPKPKNRWQWVRMQLGLQFVTTEGTLYQCG